MEIAELVAAAEAYRAALREWYALCERAAPAPEGCVEPDPERMRAHDAVVDARAALVEVCYRDLRPDDEAA